MKEECKNCKYYNGCICKRYPPKIVSGMGNTYQPNVSKNGWCGEFKEK